jgi:hypothetical protein
VHLGVSPGNPCTIARSAGAAIRGPQPVVGFEAVCQTFAIAIILAGRIYSIHIGLAKLQQHALSRDKIVASADLAIS